MIALGADEVIDYRTERFENRVKDVDLVLDFVGGETLERSWSVLVPGGAIASATTPERLRLKEIVKAWVLEPTDQPWGNRSMLFRDPDGNLINLYARIAGERR